MAVPVRCKINAVRVITASNTKIEKEINKFLYTLRNKTNLQITSCEIREGDNNNVATILYSYTGEEKDYNELIK